MKKYLLLFLSAIILSTPLISSCTTTMYGTGLTQTSNADEYTFKVFTGGFAGKGTATERAKEECEKYMVEHGYKSYNIISIEHEFLVSGFVFKVRFNK